MSFNRTTFMQILERTPLVLESLLTNLDEQWVNSSESDQHWTPFQVTAHLLQCERINWPDRLRVIMSTDDIRLFAPFDAAGQFHYSEHRSLESLVQEFSALRTENLSALRSFNIAESDLVITAEHPSLGTVQLRNLLATWTAHDLAHLSQITRTMARELRDDVGPWIKNLRILRD